MKLVLSSILQSVEAPERSNAAEGAITHRLWKISTTPQRHLPGLLAQLNKGVNGVQAAFVADNEEDTVQDLNDADLETIVSECAVQ